MATFWALAVAVPMVFGSMATSAGLGHALFRLQELKIRREEVSLGVPGATSVARGT